MANDKINEKDSLEIIRSMVTIARREHSAGAAYYYILWGAIVMFFSIATFCCLQFNMLAWQPYTYMLFLVGGILSMIHSKKYDKEEKTASWFDDLYKYVWIAISIGLGLTWAFVGVIGFSNIIPISLLLYGMGAFITGGVIRFYPSLVGGIICFLCVIVSFNVGLALQSLICAFAVLCAHLIPGILMKKSNKLHTYA